MLKGKGSWEWVVGRLYQKRPEIPYAWCEIMLRWHIVMTSQLADFTDLFVDVSKLARSLSLSKFFASVVPVLWKRDFLVKETLVRIAKEIEVGAVDCCRFWRRIWMAHMPSIRSTSYRQSRLEPLHMLTSSEKQVFDQYLLALQLRQSNAWLLFPQLVPPSQGLHYWWGHSLCFRHFVDSTSYM